MKNMALALTIYVSLFLDTTCSGQPALDHEDFGELTAEIENFGDQSMRLRVRLRCLKSDVAVLNPFRNVLLSDVYTVKLLDSGKEFLGYVHAGNGPVSISKKNPTRADWVSLGPDDEVGTVIVVQLMTLRSTPELEWKEIPPGEYFLVACLNPLAFSTPDDWESGEFRLKALVLPYADPVLEAPPVRIVIPAPIPK